MTDQNTTPKAEKSADTVATVKGIQGRVIVTDGEGNAHSARADQNLVLGDSIRVLGSSVAILDFGAAGVVTLGHDQVLTLDEALMALLNEAEARSALDEGVNFDFLQQVIEEGGSLEDVLPAAAAGEEGGPNVDGEASGGLSRFEFTANTVTPESGFETAGIANTPSAAGVEQADELGLDFILRVNNHPPVTNGIAAVSANEDVEITLDLASAFSDEDEDQTLTFEVEGLPDGLSFDEATGTISGTPTNDDALNNDGSYTVVVTASDDSGADNGTVSTTFDLQVVNVNDLPTISGAIDLGAINEDGSLVFNAEQLLEGAEDIDLDPLTVQGLTIAEGSGELAENDDGSYQFVPSENWNGSVQFNYLVDDGQGGQVANLATLNVLAVNDNPVALPDGPLTTPVNSAIQFDVLANDSDVDGDELSVVNASAMHGSVDIAEDGSLIYSPDLNYFGEDTISYTISDGAGGTATSVATIDVAYSAGEVSISGVDNTDSSQPTITGTAANIAGDLTLVVNGFSVQVTPADDGTWQYQLPEEAALEDGEYTVVVSGIDDIGNIVSADSAFEIDALLPTVSINDIEVLGAGAQVLTGSSANTDGELTLTVNGQSYAVMPEVSGAWSFEIPASDMLPDGNYSAVISGSDQAGNTASDSDSFTVDAYAPAVSIDNLDVVDTDLPTFTGSTQNTDGGLMLLVNGVEYAVSPAADGSWSFTLPAGAELNDGSYIASIRGSDAQGNSAAASDAFIVDAVNDAPRVEGLFTGVTTEGDIGDLAQASGTISISDPDVGATPAFEDIVVSGTYGELALEDGTWTYTLDQSTVQNLDAGDVINDVITLTATDGTAQDIVIAINGSSDGAVITGGFSGTVDEANLGDLVSASGSISISDVDEDDSPVFEDITVTGSYGVLTLSDGTWTYVLDQTLVQDLDAGDSLSDVISLTASDGSRQDITIQINGTDDLPVVEGDISASVSEANIGDTVIATGTIAISDVDGEDTPTFEDTNVIGTYGSFSLLDGAWTYTLDQGLVQNLDAGDRVVEQIPLVATDGTIQDITIDILGTDDLPVVSGNMSGSVAEADVGDVVTTSGSIAISDVDADDNPIFEDITVAGSYGSLSLAGGNWVYTLDQNAVQGLNVDDIVTDTIPLTATDGTQQNIVITITGADDAPVVSGDFEAALDEANIGDTVSASGTLAISDVDNQVSFDDAVVIGTYGTLSLVSGTWNYELDQGLVQALDAGDIVEDVLTLVATDGTSQDIRITISGTDDLPVITGDFSAALIEGNIGDAAAVTGTIAISDADADDVPSFADTSITGTYGSLSLVAGTWTYTLDQSTVQDLDTGDIVNDVFILTATDGTEQAITIEITGTDDSAVVSGDFAAAVTEADLGDVVTASGNIAISDVDGDDVPNFADTSITGTYGSLSLVAGAWTYTLDQSTVQDLDAGDIVNDVFTLTATDGTQQAITLEITGTNDATVVSGDIAGSVAEADLGDVVTATGTLAISDVDGDDSPSFADTNVLGTYGSLSLVSGAWTYTLDQAAVQDLDAGDIVTDILTLTATDGTQQDITIDITGTDDSAVVLGDFAAAVTEADVGDVVTASGNITISDVDGDDTPSFADTTIVGTYGSLSLVSGAWTYTLDQSTVQQLDAGDSVNDVFTLTATDGTQQAITLEIIGADDAAIVSGDVTGSVVEADIGDVVTASGNIAISDVDGDDTPSFADTSITGTYGSLSLVAGTWTYTLDQSAVQSLDAGDIVTDIITLTATDGTEQDITIEITGTDDSAVVSGDVSAAVAEADLGDVVTTSGTIAISDIDGDDAPSFADTNITGTYGSLSLVSGTWIYTLDQSAVQSLDAGDIVTDIITLTATDGTEQDITIEITGTDDSAVVSGDVSAAVAEADLGDVVTASGTIAISDIDGDDVPSFADTNITGTYGSLSLVAGTWTYTLDQSAVQSLDAGDIVTDIITVTATDGTEQDITIEITGTDDSAVVSGDVAGSVVEADIGDVVTASGNIAISDVDGDDVPSFADTSITGTYGSLSLVAGAWTYTLDQSTVQDLDVGDIVNDVFTLTATDGTQQAITLEITGADDAAIVSGDVTGAVVEADLGDTVTATGTLAISDVDGDDSPSFADTNVLGTYGSLSLVSGAWTYTLDQAAVQDLDAGDIVTDILTLTATDGTQQDITIEITGTDDSAVVSGDVNASVHEGNIGDTTSASGVIVISDADADDAPSFANATVLGIYGSLALVDNAWTYTLDQSTVQHLDAGDVVNDVITLTASDGTAQDISIQITGTDDAAVVSGDLSGAVSEADIGDIVTASGSVVIDDVDEDDAPSFIDANVTGLYGSLSLVNGAWTYTLDQSAVQSLDAGDVVNDVFTLNATDGTTQELVIAITGTNDVPVVAAASADVVQGTVLNSNVPAASDLDADASLSYNLVSNVAEGTLVFNPDGSYSFDPGSDFDDLAPGTSREVSFTYTATDDQGATSAPSTITILVSDDAENPVVSVVDGSVSEENDTFVHTFEADPFPGSPGDSVDDANGVDISDFTLENVSTVTATFISEAAGYSNAVGWYHIGADGKISSVDMLWLDSNSVAPGDAQVIDAVPEGEIGFFLIQNGYSRNDDELNAFESGVGVLRFENADGELANATDSNVVLVYYSGGDENNPTGDRTEFRVTVHAGRSNLNPDGLNHSASGISGGDNTALTIGFEDLVEDGQTPVDWDLRDFVFNLEVNSVEYSVSDISPTLTITDDGSELVSASVQLTLGRDTDQLVLNDTDSALAESYGIAVDFDSDTKTLSLSGNASIAEYQEVLANIKLASIESLGNAPRAISYYVEDSDGLLSDTVIVNLDADASYDFAQDDFILADGLTNVVGGAGDDILIASSGADNFVWRAGDDGIAASPASDVLVGFASGAGGDVLDFSDLLQDESADAVTLDDYFNFTSDGTDTTISVDADGAGPDAVTQVVSIEGVDLTVIGNDQQILQQLLSDGNLITD